MTLSDEEAMSQLIDTPKKVTGSSFEVSSKPIISLKRERHHRPFRRDNSACTENLVSCSPYVSDVIWLTDLPNQFPLRQSRYKLSIMSVYNPTVIAKDGAPEPYTLSGTALVEVTVNDENDETPEIRVMLLESSTSGQISSAMHQSQLESSSEISGNGAKFLGEYMTSISENPQPETVIAYIQVLDRDHNGQDQVHCRLGPTDNFTLQVDSPDTKYAPGRTDLSGTQTISDLANSLPNRQDFRLVTGTSLTSSIGPFTRLDREVTPTQQVTITCTDSVGNSAFVRINVQLKDVNDHAPEFVNNGHFAFQIPENQELIGGKPLWLGRTVATDKDAGDNAKISYSLEDDSETYDSTKHSYDGAMSRLFELDARTGDLYAKVVFDREALTGEGAYRLKVHAVDNGQPKLTGTAVVEVFIIDVNDWAPQFTKDVYTFSVAEDTRVQEVVGSIEAVDRDADSQGKITYHLITHIKQPTALYTRGIRKTRSAGSKVPFKDALFSTFKSSKERSYMRKGREVSNPEVGSEEIQRTTSSYADTSVSVLQISPNPDFYKRREQKASDENNFNVLTENVPKQHNYFSVDRLSGKIRLIRRLDRESVAFFSLEIVATDSPPVSILPVRHQQSGSYTNFTSNVHLTPKILSSSTTVVIAVTDVNDNSPVFRSPNTSTAIQVRLQETLGKQLLTFEATDADEGENARISYSIRTEVPRPPGGPGTGYFSVDETSGLLFLARTLNNTATHRLVVEACDNGSGTTRRCTLSPNIRITVFDGTEGQNNGDLGLYQGRSLQSGPADMIPFDLDTFAARSAAAAQSGRRNEVIVVCLVVIFSCLLLATIFLVACILHRRGSRPWLLGRSTNADGQILAKDVSSTPKPNHANLKSNGDPWIDDEKTFYIPWAFEIHQRSSSFFNLLLIRHLRDLSATSRQRGARLQNEETEMVLDPKLDTCKAVSYGTFGPLLFSIKQRWESLHFALPLCVIDELVYLVHATECFDHNFYLGMLRKMSIENCDNVGCSGNEPKYLARDTMFPGVAYPVHTYIPAGVKLTPGSQNFFYPTHFDPTTLVHTSPVRRITMNSPVTLDVQGHKMTRHPQPMADINELLTQSSYKPPSPDYQSLDTMWQPFPSPDPGAGKGSSRYRNPVLLRGTTQAKNATYSPGHCALVRHQPAESDGVLFSNTSTADQSQNGPHTYYEITETQDQLGSPKHALNTEMESVDELNTTSYNRTATLGRTTVGKGKRRVTQKDDSMHNLKAGELALHSSKRSSGRKQESDLLTDEVKNGYADYRDKPSNGYTYQAYREGTFV
ncbi:cadherin-related tumor suppressor [Clonorchis sinensis]|uniref:Cadherin-related tumor suppressor n=1 Tax=Clonorchis sinensis TaxID=79923 RepID=G7YRL7_CLOSI|nr:cadherin-related tumor suppressor [Clonorchis sinensis]